jgi:hypothetical protein
LAENSTAAPTGEKRESGDAGTTGEFFAEITVDVAGQQRGRLGRRFIGSKVPVVPAAIEVTPSCNTSNGGSGTLVDLEHTILDSSSPPKNGSARQESLPDHRFLGAGVMPWLSRLGRSTSANWSPKLVRGSSASSTTSTEDGCQPRCNDSPFIAFRSFKRAESSLATSVPSLTPDIRVPLSLSPKSIESDEPLQSGTSTHRPPPPAPAPTGRGQNLSSAEPPLMLLEKHIRSLNMQIEPDTEPSQEMQLSPIEEQMSQHASSQEPNESGSGGNGRSCCPGMSSPKANDTESDGCIEGAESDYPRANGRFAQCGASVLNSAGHRADRASVLGPTPVHEIQCSGKPSPRRRSSRGGDTLCTQVLPQKGGRRACFSRDISPQRTPQPAQSTPRPATKEPKHKNKPNPKRLNSPAHV